MVKLPAHLPGGAEWFDFWTGERIASGYIIADAPLGKIPVFVRGGAVLPLSNVRQSTDEPLSELTLRVYPAGESTFTLSEDAGDGYGFEQGEVARTRVRVTQHGAKVKVVVSAREGSFTPAARQVVLEVYPGEQPGQVTLDGDTVETRWQNSAVRVSYQDDGQGHVLELS